MEIPQRAGEAEERRGFLRRNPRAGQVRGRSPGDKRQRRLWRLVAKGFPAPIPPGRRPAGISEGFRSGIKGQSRASCVPGNVPDVVSLLPVHQS